MSKYNINIDRLKLCLLSKDGVNLYDYIESIDNYNINYHLRQTHKNESEIGYDVYSRGIDVKLGHLTVNKAENGCISTYHFFEFSNEALYTKFSGNSSLICLVDYVFDDLGLILNNVTRIEIALDTTANIVTKIDRIIKNKNITMLLNNKIVRDMTTKLRDAFYTYGRSRAKRDRVPSLFFKGCHNQIKIYNKAQEIVESSAKDYILDWNNFNSKRLYRLEVRLDRIGWADAISEIGLDMTYIPDNWLTYLSNEFLPKIWEVGLGRVLRFKNGKEYISILGIL